MPRALLLVCGIGLALVGCKSSDQPAPAPASAPAPAAAGSGSGSAAGSADTAITGAGKVLEVSGQVTIAGKPATVGQAVTEDDLVETGDDGRVTIVLAHNLAHWQLGPGKHQKVSESIAWKLPRSEGNSGLVIQDMTSAGRPAERNAADSVASAPAPGGAAAPAKPEQKVAAPARIAAPAPPPPPTVQPTAGVIGGESHTSRGPLAQSPAQGPRADELLSAKTPDLHACLDAGQTMLIVSVDISATGVGTAHVSGDASASAKACVAKVIAGIQFPAHKATASISISR